MQETLYLGIDNPLIIATDGASDTHLEVTVSSGKISGTSGNYFFRPLAEGVVPVTARTIDNSGFITDEFIAQFTVKSPPPSITIQGLTGGLITHQKFMDTAELQITVPYNIPESAYEIESFKISEHYSGTNGKYGQGKSFTRIQKRYIEKLSKNNESTPIYIKEIKVKSADGQRFNIQTMGFILQK